MPARRPDEARQTLERLRAALNQPLPDISCAVNASIGAVTFMMPPDDIQAMIQIADAAMYSAKQDGKNRIHFDVIGPNMPKAKVRRPTDLQTSAARHEPERPGR